MTIVCDVCRLMLDQIPMDPSFSSPPSKLHGSMVDTPSLERSLMEWMSCPPLRVPRLELWIAQSSQWSSRTAENCNHVMNTLHVYIHIKS